MNRFASNNRIQEDFLEDSSHQDSGKTSRRQTLDCALGGADNAVWPLCGSLAKSVAKRCISAWQTASMVQKIFTVPIKTAVWSLMTIGQASIAPTQISAFQTALRSYGLGDEKPKPPRGFQPGSADAQGC